MFNLASLIIGVVALLGALPALLPLLGWLNWFILPLAVLGLALGVISKSTSGRNLNLLVIIVCIVRLSLGGGFI